MKKQRLATVILVSCLCSAAVSYFYHPAQTSVQAAKETGFERMTRTGVLRCGYYVFPPITYQDPNTKQMSGFSVDFMNDLAARAGIKIEWTEEVTFGNWVPALQTGRFDAICTPMWPEIAMQKAIAFTDPLFYSGLSPIVRKDDARFTNDRARLNEPDVTFVVQEGNITDKLTHDAFPRAKFDTLPAMADGAQYYQDILNKKADATISDRNALREINKTNGDQLRLIDPEHPVKLQAMRLAAAQNDTAMNAFINQALAEMSEDGTIDRLLLKWEAEPGLTYIRRASLAAKQGVQ